MQESAMGAKEGGLVPFTAVDTAAVTPTRLIVAPWGEPKSGKTSFGLSFPKPLFLFNLDHSYQELLGNHAGAEIYVANYELGDEYHYETYLKAIEQFRKDWIEAVNQADERGGSVVLDKASQFWSLIGPTLKEKAHRVRIARNASAREMQTDYALPNSLMDGVLKRPYHFPRVNACYIMGAKERYSENGQALNTFQPQGWGDTESVVQLVLGLITRKGEIVGRIDRARFGKNYEGLELASPTYDSLMAVLA